MNKFIIYFKQHPERILGLAVVLFISSYFTSFHLNEFVLFVIYAVAEYHQNKNYRNFLDRQGLTPQQYDDKKFVENWKETRQAGLTRYCFFDGGMILGSILSIFIGAAFFKSGLLGDVTKDLSGMMELIWKSFVLGFMFASVLNRIKWPYNEKRLAKLIGGNPIIDV